MTYLVLFGEVINSLRLLADEVEVKAAALADFLKPLTQHFQQTL